ncbi:hypothetical protein ElyMa_006575100 [Elysia marginata]|uniref:Uncharacterized protein n=1 Tax=Elysia marginata TaxID=1093978 RepID=A0AAV4IFC0_9GAST|nr:hypothetical protein ElyMa_006575100 [Elysia marginata]
MNGISPQLLGLDYRIPPRKMLINKSKDGEKRAGFGLKRYVREDIRDARKVAISLILVLSDMGYVTKTSHLILHRVRSRALER